MWAKLLIYYHKKRPITASFYQLQILLWPSWCLNINLAIQCADPTYWGSGKIVFSSIWFSFRLAKKIISKDAHASTKRHRIIQRGKKQDRDCPLSPAGWYYIISTILFKHPLWEISSGPKCWPQERWDCEQTHRLLFGISGKQDFWASLSCYGISSKALLPCLSCSQTAAKWFQNRSHGSWIQPHSFLFKGRLLNPQAK